MTTPQTENRWLLPLLLFQGIGSHPTFRSVLNSFCSSRQLHQPFSAAMSASSLTVLIFAVLCRLAPTLYVYPDPRVSPYSCKVTLPGPVCDPSEVLSDYERESLADAIYRVCRSAKAAAFPSFGGQVLFLLALRPKPPTLFVGGGGDYVGIPRPYSRSTG